MPLIPFGDFSKLKQMELKNPDLQRQIFYGENVMLVKNIIPPHGVIPKHRHIHEQITYVSEGECEVIINGEQKTHATPGCVALFPPNAEHEVIALGDSPLICWDIFSPVREDFIEAFEKETM